MADDSKPFVSAEESLPELTLKALLLGVVVAALLGAANAYLGFKAGQTVSATFPAAVLAIAAFRLPFFRGTVLEQNTMRTAASVGEALAAGAIFTVPAFVMVNVNGQRLWTGFNYWETSLILLVGGLLGILFIILLRRTLTVDAAAALPREPRLLRDREDGPARRHRRALRVRGNGPRDADSGLQGPGRHPPLPREPRFREGVPGLGDPPHGPEPGAARRRDPPGRPRAGDAVHLAGAHRRRLHHRVRALGHQLRRRRPRLARARAARPLPQPRPRRAALDPERPARPARPSSSRSGTTRSGRSRSARCSSARRRRCSRCATRSRRPSAAPSTRAARPRSCAPSATCRRAASSPASPRSPCR